MTPANGDQVDDEDLLAQPPCRECGTALRDHAAGYECRECGLLFLRT
ncbi:hypothetical protein ACPW96_20215 [Micromonospora sp. DT81.3]